jgi:hypothetical protein
VYDFIVAGGIGEMGLLAGGAVLGRLHEEKLERSLIKYVEEKLEPHIKLHSDDFLWTGYSLDIDAKAHAVYTGNDADTNFKLSTDISFSRMSEADSITSMFSNGALSFSIGWQKALDVQVFLKFGDLLHLQAPSNPPSMPRSKR